MWTYLSQMSNEAGWTKAQAALIEFLNSAETMTFLMQIDCIFDLIPFI